MDDASKFVSKWYAELKTGSSYDLWGQPVEAVDQYQRLLKSIQQITQTDCKYFSQEQKTILSKINTCLELRCQSLLNPGAKGAMTIDRLQKVEPVLKNVLNFSLKDFPIDIPSGMTLFQPYIRHLGEDDEEEKDIIDTVETLKGSLLPRLIMESGRSYLTIRIEKIGLKDACQYIDPYITVTIKGVSGYDLTVIQNTPVATRKQDNYITFGVDVEVQKPLEILPYDYAIFFEFKHYKPKKKLTSIKCFAFMERDEIKPGAAVIELYKKPTDFKRKNLHLLTVKPLYLHVTLSLQTI